MLGLSHQALRLAYRGQQASLHGGCAAIQAVVRRLVFDEQPQLSGTTIAALRNRFDALLEQDLANAHAGIYPASLLFQIPLLDYAKVLPSLARDIPRVIGRMRTGDYRDLPTDVDLTAYPAYYRRTFHWQTDGYLSHQSARLYDIGVEFLFGGTADVMRRQVIVPLAAAASESAAGLRILDVGCGTGRTLAQIHRALPHANLVGLDLSSFYLDLAREQTSSLPIEFVEANAEVLPFPEGSFDAVTSVFLFHELPRNARRRVLAEMARVVRPGGKVVILDSVQHSDGGGLSFFIERFSRDFHEPFYQDYLRDELADGLSEVGLEVEHPADPVFLSKRVVARRVS